MLAAEKRRHRHHRSTGDIQPRESQRSRRQRREVCGETIGDEDDRRAVGRERRLELGKRVVRQPIELSCLERHQVQVDFPALVAAEHDLPSTRRK
jgi:hypothetical protein